MRRGQTAGLHVCPLRIVSLYLPSLVETLCLFRCVFLSRTLTLPGTVSTCRSQIFSWHSSDFGSESAKLDLIRHWLGERDAKPAGGAESQAQELLRQLWKVQGIDPETRNAATHNVSLEFVLVAPVATLSRFVCQQNALSLDAKPRYLPYDWTPHSSRHKPYERANFQWTSAACVIS